MLKDQKAAICAEWLHGLADWGVVMTLTFKKYPYSDLPRSTIAIKKTMRFLITRLNKHAFGHRAQRQKYRIASAFVIECGPDGHHGHAHATLSIPVRYTTEEFSIIVNNLIKKFTTIDTQVDIQPYRNSGWHAYCLKHGVENLVAEDITEAHPKG